LKIHSPKITHELTHKKARQRLVGPLGCWSLVDPTTPPAAFFEAHHPFAAAIVVKQTAIFEIQREKSMKKQKGQHELHSNVSTMALPTPLLNLEINSIDVKIEAVEDLLVIATRRAE